MICWMVRSWFFCPFYHNSTPYNAVDCTTDSWICRTSPGTKSYVLVSSLIWISAALALLTLSLIWDVNLSWLSSHTPNHRVAFLLNEISSLPALSFVSCSCLFNRCRFDFEKVTASVFDVSKVTAFSVPHSITVWATFSRVFTTSFTRGKARLAYVCM